MSSVGADTASGAASGALAGAAFGPWGALAGAAVGGGISYYKSRKQKKAADAINATRPTYKMPTEVGANVNMYNTMANTSRLPGQSLMEDNLKASTASSFNQAQNAAGGSGGAAMLAALGKVSQNESDSINKLNIAGAENQQVNIDKLANARNTMADYKQQEFNYNENQPYELALMRKRALEGASEANADSAKQDLQTGLQVGGSMIGGGKKGKASKTYSPMGSSGSFGSGTRGVYTGSMGVR